MCTSIVRSLLDVSTLWADIIRLPLVIRQGKKLRCLTEEETTKRTYKKRFLTVSNNFVATTQSPGGARNGSVNQWRLSAFKALL